MRSFGVNGQSGLHKSGGSMDLCPIWALASKASKSTREPDLLPATVMRERDQSIATKKLFGA